ncbi:unnamed protein product [marine sediment metagenome]|uniref:GH16 domain-containing protein n=1 Tax=marine sediment metagenome TaxID=412755 RepID=X1K2U4_9ZZZZ
MPISGGAAPGLSIAEILTLWETKRLNFFDEFNRAVEDTDVWTFGSDGGSFNDMALASEGTIWNLMTGGVIDNDAYIHGDGCTRNKYCTPFELGYDTVTWEARLRVAWATNQSAFYGLIDVPITDFAEPVSDCAHFLVDTTIGATFLARSHQAAEEQTDTGIALDGLFHRFKIIWSRTQVLFYIDDVLVATHAAQVPTEPGTSELLARTEQAVAQNTYIDYVRMEMS